MFGRAFDVLFLAPSRRVVQGIWEAMPGALEPGARLVLFALVVNLMLVPLYAEMERGSRRRRQVEEAVRREVARMKRNFTGRERYFYVRAVYRQFGYRPWSGLLSSGSLVVQVLVFSTMYRFLVAHPGLVGVPFGPIADLGRPDGLFGVVHALPLVMTAFNVLSVLQYSEDRAERLRGLGLAGLFLVLLYESPSGMVLYWTTNNFFSMVRSVTLPMLQGRQLAWLRTAKTRLLEQA